VSHARGRFAEVAVIVGLVGLCVMLWLLRGALEPAAPTALAPPAGVATGSSPSPTSMETPVSPSATLEPPPRPEPREPPEVLLTSELHGDDTVDPCTTGVETTIPSGYDLMTVDGITVAWSPDEVVPSSPYDVTFQPTTIAYLVNGLLVEAASLTGTPRRERLTVVFYPSQETFLARTKAPAWAGGLYDGGAVRLAIDPETELGVKIPALRHELMHAQLHTAVGCLPAWFNEGLAMYFAGTPPVREWVKMLRSPEPFDLTLLQASSLARMPSDQAASAYAESLAMIIYLLGQAGEAGVKAAVQTQKAVVRTSPRAGRTLWERLYPNVGHHEVLNILARKVFGVALGSELDATFTNTICCYGYQSVHTFGCRGVPPQPGKEAWLDRTGSPVALCRTTW
jgi:hypothetical protein